MNAPKSWQSLLAVGILAGMSACGGNPQSSATSSPSELTGSALAAAASQEGQVVWYETLDTPNATKVVNAFEKAYPSIKVNALRLTSSALPARVITEQRGHEYNADVISGDAFEFEQIQLAGGIQKYSSPEASAYPSQYKDPNGYWVNMYLLTTVIAWNPARVQADGLTAPQTLADLANSAWQGKFSFDPGAYDWFAGLVNDQGSSAVGTLQKLAANRPVPVKGHTSNTTEVENGQVDATATAYGNTAEQDKAKGKPIDYVNPNPTIVSLTPIGLAKNAPHPSAARVFENWIISKAGQDVIVTQTDRISPRSDVTNNSHVWNPGQVHYVVASPDLAKDYNKYVSQYKQIFGLS